MTTAQVTIWHNPKCSKSRETLALLEERGADITTRLYLEDIPTVEELKEVGQKLRLQAKDWIRRKEQVFADLGLATDSPEEELIRAMATNPKLIERPIVIVGDKAKVGRPPEQVLGLFE